MQGRSNLVSQRRKSESACVHSLQHAGHQLSAVQLPEWSPGLVGGAASAMMKDWIYSASPNGQCTGMDVHAYNHATGMINELRLVATDQLVAASG